MSESRKLAAILVADVVGYSRLAGADEDRTLARLRGLRSDLIEPAIAAHHGRTVKRTGDGFVVEFRSVVDAVRCAIEIQSAMVERNAGVLPEKRIEFRIGIHVGDDFGGDAEQEYFVDGERARFRRERQPRVSRTARTHDRGHAHGRSARRMTSQAFSSAQRGEKVTSDNHPHPSA